jgi:hypothetical protein
MTHDAWTVHTTYHVEMLYPKNVRLILDDKYETGIRFDGDEGWVFCTRDEEKATASDPAVATGGEVLLPLRASDKKILLPPDGNAVRWMPSKSQHGNWLESIAVNRQPIAPIQQSARSLEACAAAWISMKLKRRLTWNPATEMFADDAAANALRGRPARKPEFDFRRILQKAGVA